MEPKRLTIGELIKMQEGEIPMTDEGREQIQRFKNATSSIHENLGNLIAKANNALPTHINHQLFQNHSLLNYKLSNPIFAQVVTSHETIQKIASDFSGKSLEIQNKLRKAFVSFNTNFNYGIVTEIFKKLENDPILHRRFKLLSEKERLISNVINAWKKNLEYRIDHMPFESFEYHFEHACYDMLDNARNNDELSDISEESILDILFEVAARIKVSYDADSTNRIRRQKNILKGEGEKITIEIPEEKLSLFIPSSVQTILVKSFSRNISEVHVEALELLFQNGYSTQQIWVKVSAGRLSKIFKQVKESDQYMRELSMTSLSIWVAAHFCWGPKKPKPISRHTVFNVLRR